MKKGLALFATFLVATFLIGANSWAAEMMTAPKPATVKPVPIVKPAVTPQPATTSEDAQQAVRMLMPSPQPPKEIQVLQAEAKKLTQKPRQRQLTMGEMEQKFQAIPIERERLNIAKSNKKKILTSQVFNTSVLTNISLSSDNKFFSPSSASETGAWADATFFGVLKSHEWWDDPYLMCEYNGHVDFSFRVPADGYYIIDFYGGGGSNTATLSDENGIITRWDYMHPTSHYNDYLTLQYMSAGLHYLYFRPDNCLGFHVFKIWINTY